MTILKRLFLCLLLLVLLISAVGCKSSVQAPFRYALETEPATLDPAKSTAIPESLVELQIFEGLTRLDNHDEPLPGVATSWEISPDGLHYRFHLREDAKWSNGDPVVAADFEYAWKRALDPAVASENAYMLYSIKNAEDYNSGKASADSVGISAVDTHTLDVELEKPTAYFLSLVAFHAFYPVYRPAIEAHPDNWAIQSPIISNGPFKIDLWLHNGKIDFSPNEMYWDRRAVKLTHMSWPIVDSQTTRMLLTESNQVDMMVEPPITEYDRLSQTNKLKIAPYLGSYYYVFNTDKAPFNNPKVRQAFSLALSRQFLVNHIIKGGKEPAYAWVPPGLKNPATGQDFRLEGGNLVAEDIALAKKLLAQAGYPDGQGLPPITILFNSGELHKAIAEAIQEMWKQNLGVSVTLVNQESKVFLASRAQGDFQVARASWIGDYSDPMTFMDVFKDPENDAKYKNETYNELIKQAQSTLDPSVRMTAMHQAEKLLLKDAVVIPIYYTTQPYLVSPRLKNYSWSVLGLADFKSAYLEEDGL
ncbi:MAG: peptide ABC transporter substrate-binding protein [Sporomusaceae bacterium]|nr:peptide ABC transporter substrate-binding protein [Sporomusaceae bacterium]